MQMAWLKKQVGLHRKMHFLYWTEMEMELFRVDKNCSVIQLCFRMEVSRKVDSKRYRTRIQMVMESLTIKMKYLIS